MFLHSSELCIHRGLFRSILKNVYGSAHFIPNWRKMVNMSSSDAIPFSNLLPKNSVSFTSLSLLWHCRSLGLPQVVMDGEGIHADRHGFGWNHIKLFSVRTVLIKFVNHFLGDALWPCSSQLVDFFSVRVVAIKCSELAAGIAEQNDVVVGITFF